MNAGRRRYFFDVKATRADDYYLVITESTRRYNDDGTDRYDRHRLFLYKEDFNKFSDRMAEVMDFIKRERGETPIRHAPQAEQSASLPTSKAESTQEPTETTEQFAIAGPASDEKAEGADTTGESSEFTDVKFEDLGYTPEEKEEISDGKVAEDTSSDPPAEANAKEENSSLEEDQPSTKEEEETKKAEKE